MNRCLSAGVCVTMTVAAACPGGSAEGHDLQSLIDAAPPGATLRVAPGLYRGEVTVSKPLTLIGDGWPVIDARGLGSGLRITAPDVVVRGLLVRHSGDSLDREDTGITVQAPRVQIIGNRLEDVLFGIVLRGADDSVVADNLVGAKALPIARRGDGIRLWSSHRVRIERNRVVDGRDCVFWFSNQLLVRGNEMRRSRYGLHFMYADDSRVEENRLEDNSVGVFLMYSARLALRRNLMRGNAGPSGYGLGLKDMDGVEAEGNWIIGNRVGIFLDNSPSSIDVTQHFRGNLLADNEVGIAFQPSVQRNVFSGNAFIDNGEAVAVRGEGRFTGNTWTVAGRGNYWSEYAGYDAQRDGIGDVPFRRDNLFGGLMDRQPSLALFAGTPAVWMLDQAARAFPVIRLEARVIDTAPLIAPPAIPPPPGAVPRPSAAPGTALGTALLMMAVLVVGSAFRPRHRQARPS